MKRRLLLFFITIIFGVQLAETVWADIQQVGGPMEGTPQHLEIQGKYAYVAASSVFSILDVSDPTHPRQVSYLPMPKLTNHIVVSGKYAYLLSGYALTIVDISDPANPKKTAGNWSGFRLNDLAMFGNFALIASDENGLHIVDVSNPDSPKEISMVKNIDPISSNIAVSGNYAFLSDGVYGLHIIDIKDPANPKKVRECKTGHLTGKIVIHDKYAYVHEAAYLLIYDITVPTTPIKIYQNLMGFEDFTIVGNQAYVASGDELTVLDIGEPYLIDEAVKLKLSRRLVGVNGDYIYLAWENGSIQGVNIRKPSPPYTSIVPEGADNIPLWHGIISPETRKKVLGDILLRKFKKNYTLDQRLKYIFGLASDSNFKDAKFDLGIYHACKEPEIQHAIIDNLTAYNLAGLSDGELEEIAVSDNTFEARKRVIDEMFRRGRETEGWRAFKSIFPQVVTEEKLTWIPYRNVREEAVKREIIAFLKTARDNKKSPDSVKVYASTVLYADFRDPSAVNRKYIFAGVIDEIGATWVFHVPQFIDEEISKMPGLDLNAQKLDLIKEDAHLLYRAIGKHDIKTEELEREKLQALVAPKDLEFVFQQEKADSLNASLRNKEMKPVYVGELPKSFPHPRDGAPMKCLPINCFYGQRNTVVAREGSKLMFFTFDKNICKKMKAEINLPDNLSKDAFWTVGDYDNDKQDEILLCSGTTLIVYKWSGWFWNKKFKTIFYHLKDPVLDLVCGDINNNNENELVIFQPLTPAKSVVNDRGADRTLEILKYRNGKIETVWKDLGKYRFSNGDMVPPDRLGLIADLDNTGVNRLIIYDERSDVGPRNYTTFVWGKNGLDSEDTFRIERYRLKYGMETLSLSPWIDSDLYPIRKHGQYYFYAGDWGMNEAKPCFINLLKIEKGELQIIARTPRIFDMSLLVSDIDSHGEGLLEIIPNQNHFEFYKFQE